MVDSPAEQMELLWGGATSLVAVVKTVVGLVAWGSPQLGDLQLGHWEKGVR